MSFKQYPFVIVHPVKVSFSRRNLARTFAQVDWETIIEVRSADTFGKESTATDPSPRSEASEKRTRRATCWTESAKVFWRKAILLRGR